MHFRFAFAILLGFALFSSSASASVIYLADGDGSIVYSVDLNTQTYSSFSTYSLAYPIAVVDTIRMGHRDNGAGAEYTLDGTPTGVTWSGGTSISQLLDGTTDGTTYNYAVSCCGSDGVYRFDRFWGNAELLFELPNGGSGITYDLATNTLWVALFSGDVQQYDLSGELLSSTTALSSYGLVALSYDSSSGTFWGYNQGDTFYNFDRNGTVLNTVAISGFSTGNVYGGEMAMSAVPEPSSAALILLGIAGTLFRRRSKRE